MLKFNVRLINEPFFFFFFFDTEATMSTDRLQKMATDLSSEIPKSYRFKISNKKKMVEGFFPQTV